MKSKKDKFTHTWSANWGIWFWSLTLRNFCDLISGRISSHQICSLSSMKGDILHWGRKWMLFRSLCWLQMGGHSTSLTNVHWNWIDRECQGNTLPFWNSPIWIHLYVVTPFPISYMTLYIVLVMQWLHLYLLYIVPVGISLFLVVVVPFVIGLHYLGNTGV